MKRKITLITVLTIALSFSQGRAQILTNGGFETWATGPSGHLDPDGWTTSNNSTSQANVIQGSPRTGNYSCSLISIPDGFGGFETAGIYLTYIGAIKPLTFSGWWKGTFNADSTDGISIFITVTDTNFNASFVTINTPVSTNLPNWTYFSDTLVYADATPGLQASISITLASDSAITNGQLDDLSMTYAVGIDDIIEAHFPSAVLRPDAQALNHILYVDLLSSQSFTMNIFNIDGRKIYERDFNLPGGHHEFSVPTENLPEGMYLCTITGNRMQRGMKFVK